MNTDSATDSLFEKIQMELQANLDRPARMDRFEVFQSSVAAYLTETETSLPAQGRGVFLVAGTNGKGSVAKTIETVLSTQDKSVGLFTSPHLMDTTERIRSWGSDLTRAEFVEIYEFVSAYRERFDLSHFEVLTLMMIETFFGGRTRKKVSSAVIEVGVGGRLDPTRVVPHEIAVVTRLGLDHQAILGDLSSIAREKFAIAEGSRILVYAKPETRETEAALQDAVRKFPQTRFLEASHFQYDVARDASEPVWKIKTEIGEQVLSLRGARSVFNASIAVSALQAAGLSLKQILPSLARVEWPCRMERLVLEDQSFYLSGDHNPQGIASLQEILAEYRFRTLWLVVGIGKNKPVDEMLTCYFAFPEAWNTKIVLTTTVFRALKPEDYGPWAEKAEVVLPDAREALRYALARASKDDLVVVSGSLYLVGDLRARLLSQTQSSELDRS